MAVIKQGGLNPNFGKTLTTRGYKDKSVRQCGSCGLDKPDAIFTRNANGQDVCPDCAGPKHAAVLAQPVEESIEPDASGA